MYTQSDFYALNMIYYLSDFKANIGLPAPTESLQMQLFVSWKIASIIENHMKNLNPDFWLLKVRKPISVTVEKKLRVKQAKFRHIFAKFRLCFLLFSFRNFDFLLEISILFTCSLLLN